MHEVFAPARNSRNHLPRAISSSTSKIQRDGAAPLRLVRGAGVRGMISKGDVPVNDALATEVRAT
jgi:hypothetical protein